MKIEKRLKEHWKNIERMRIGRTLKEHWKNIERTSKEHRKNIERTSKWVRWLHMHAKRFNRF
jgi:hypothetical protein